MIAVRYSYRYVSTYSVEAKFYSFLRERVLPADRGTIAGRTALEGKVVHIPDIAADPDYTLSQTTALGKLRTLLGAPLLRDGEVIGTLTLTRSHVEPFSERQIELVRTFADQAVIAIENTRLITETREALNAQQAIAEVMHVINASSGDLAPVFQAMLDKAMALCGAGIGGLGTWQGERFSFVAALGVSQSFTDFIAHNEISPGPRSGFLHIARGRGYVQFEDLATSPFYAGGDSLSRAIVDLDGGHTTLTVPLVRDDEVLGVICAVRREVRPFSERQIALLKNFAGQAVVAIENARLLTETHEALEQQTATAEVLQVINSSPGDLVPVWDAMLEKAANLCDARLGFLCSYDGEAQILLASRGASLEVVEMARRVPIEPTSSVGRLACGKDEFIHTPDITDDPVYRSGVPSRRLFADATGARTALWIALRKDNVLIGVFILYRTEVRPFTDKQIALLRNFAAQAVIAMDNARLLNEIRRRQTELRVTFDNMGDGVAMFDAELRLAAWNRNFQQILGLPDDFLAEQPSLADYVRYLAMHGEYGAVDVEAEVRRLTEIAGRQWSTERTRPDGHIIEVRVNPVPGGGIVLIYGDVTERKRAEAEIRAARDAAERALGELRATQQQLVVQQKMAALGQLTAGIAHEIKNPLNFVNNFAGLSIELLDELKETAAPGIEALDADTRAEIAETFAMLTGNLDKIAEHGRRADGIVKSMLLHSRGGSGERQSVDLNALIDEALNLAYHGARAQDQNFNITIERDFAAGLAPIELVPQDVTRVFLNLIGNGFYAAHKRAREAGDGFRPVLTVATRDLGDAVEVRVRDNGAGIAPEHRDRLFQPFFTTKPTGEGTGLGLSISHDIVTTQHGGTITVDSDPGTFTEFTVRLPRR